MKNFNLLARSLILSFVLSISFFVGPASARQVSQAPGPVNNPQPGLLVTAAYPPPVEAVVSYTTFDLSTNVASLYLADINNQSGVIRKHTIDSLTWGTSNNLFLGASDMVLSPWTNEIHMVYPKRTSANAPGTAIYVHKQMGSNNFIFETIPYPSTLNNDYFIDTDIILTDPSTGGRVIMGLLAYETNLFNYYLAERQSNGSWTFQVVPLGPTTAMTSPKYLELSYEYVNSTTELIHIDYIRSVSNGSSTCEYVRLDVNFSQPGWPVFTSQTVFSSFNTSIGPSHFGPFLGQNNSTPLVSSFNIENFIGNAGISGFYLKNFQLNSPPQLLAVNGRSGSTASVGGNSTLTFNVVEEENNGLRELVYYLHDGINTLARNVLRSVSLYTSFFNAAIDQGMNTIAISFMRPISFSPLGEIIYNEIDPVGNVLNSHIVESCLSGSRTCSGPIQIRVLR